MYFVCFGNFLPHSGY